MKEYEDIVAILAREHVKEDRIKREMLTDVKYMDWLVDFTLRFPKFYHDDWLYAEDSIDIKDLENAKNICYLFDVINDYLSKNYIVPYKGDWDEYYLIKYNNIGFKIGVMSGQGTSFYCERVSVDKNNLDNFIDFYHIFNKDDIRYGNRYDEGIINKFNELVSIVRSLYESGVDIEDIVITFNNTIDKIDDDECYGDTKVRVLKK